MSGALAGITVGVVVERRKAQSPWIDFTWRPVTVLVGLPDAAPWTQLSADGDGATFYVGTADIELFRTETSQLPQQSCLRRAIPVGGAAADRRRAAL